MFWDGEHCSRIAKWKGVENDTCSLSKIFKANIQAKDNEIGRGTDLRYIPLIKYKNSSEGDEMFNENIKVQNLRNWVNFSKLLIHDRDKNHCFVGFCFIGRKKMALALDMSSMRCWQEHFFCCCWNNLDRTLVVLS